jgi:hypothetical protein
MAPLTIDMAMAGQDRERRSAISARYGTTPHFDLLQEFAQAAQDSATAEVHTSLTRE